MNARALIPLIVVALAAFFGYSQYQSCAITLPGLPEPAQCRVTPGVNTPSTPYNARSNTHDPEHHTEQDSNCTLESTSHRWLH
jgi:hypothetical protein